MLSLKRLSKNRSGSIKITAFRPVINFADVISKTYHFVIHKSEFNSNIPKWHIGQGLSIIAFWNIQVAKTIYTRDRQIQSAKLVQAREDAGYTQKQVQEAINISQSELSKIEKGQRKVESLILSKLADLYKKPVAFFLSGVLESVDERTSYWYFKSVSDSERSYKSIDGYNDELTKKYVYDSSVPNNKQVKAGDIAAICDKEKVLGFAKVSRVAEHPDKKTRQRCPECKSTNYEERLTKTPKYRCNNGHEFDKLESVTVDITKYHAFYGTSFTPSNQDISVKELRPYYEQGYNRNNSIQRLKAEFFNKITPGILKLMSNQPSYLGPKDSAKFEDDDGQYSRDNNDSRVLAIRQIKVRRGAEDFRKKLLEKFNGTCVITGCKIEHLLEAAHINPYRGINDNHSTNGLLLRADIHTLFDLDFIGINPKTLTIQVNKEVLRDGYEKLDGKTLIGCSKPNCLSIEAMEYRWKLFLNNYVLTLS